MPSLVKTRNGIFLGLCLLVALVSWRFMIGGVTLTMDHVAYHAMQREVAFYAHVVFAPVALAAMPFQFNTNLRNRRRSLHRWMGRVYVLAIMISGLGSLGLALGTQAGPTAAIGFGLLGVLWLGTTANAVRLVIQGDIAGHQRWMIRSAALTFAAVTLRLYLPGLAIGFGMETGYTIVAWLCWVPNLIVAEWVFLAPRRVIDHPVTA